MASQLSEFSEEKKNTFATTFDPMLDAVPVINCEVYDPDNADADWAGLVKRSSAPRKHESHHVSQAVSLVQVEDGIIGKDEKQAWARKRRDVGKVPTGDSAGMLIGGIAPSTEEQWLTNMSRQNAGLKTDRDQLTLMKRALPRKPLEHEGKAGSPLSPRGVPLAAKAASENQHPAARPAAPRGRQMFSAIAAELASDSAIEEEARRLEGGSKRVDKHDSIGARLLLSENYNVQPGAVDGDCNASLCC